MKTQDLTRIEEIKSGNIKEFELLFREFYKPLLIHAYRILQDREEAEEVVQNLFFNIWKNRQDLNINIAVNSYLYSAVRNNSLQFIKRQKIKNKYEQYLLSYSADAVEPIEYLEYNELHNKLYQVMNDLPERCQEIFKLNRFQGLKYQEIADQLKISIKTVEANMSKALKHFRKNLNEFMVSS
ncbi:MAG: RNA polymerase sigma-70 factor [Bacteroidetes bacterium HGW-Bacteroidetes-17]|nr:MAG: RNA polymerase sigma-70 factor [Bacteroidetes bacterium HGW-Bacteroidetes-17]